MDGHTLQNLVKHCGYLHIILRQKFRLRTIYGHSSRLRSQFHSVADLHPIYVETNLQVSIKLSFVVNRVRIQQDGAI